MKEKFMWSALLIVAFLFFSNNLYALGIGIYGSASFASIDWTYHIDESEDPKIKSNLYKTGFGFIMDTNLSKDKMFNYRLNIGYSIAGINNKNDAGINFNAKEYALYNSFGFGIIRKETIRFWVGPQLGFGLFKGDYLPSYIGKEVYDFDAFFVSYGAAAGLNLNTMEYFTLGIDGGIRGISYFGLATMGKPYPTASESIGVTGDGIEVFINFCFILRINDDYRN